MQHSVKRILALVVVNLTGILLMGLPLLGAGICALRKRWVPATLCVGMFFVARRIQFVIERRLNMRSLSNPESQTYGSGLTWVAPWVRNKQTKGKQSEDAWPTPGPET